MSDKLNEDVESAFLELLEKFAIKPLSNSFFERIEALKERAENNPHAELKAQYTRDAETCKNIDGLEAWQLWQYMNLGSWYCCNNTPFLCLDLIYRRHPHADNIIAYHKCSERDKRRWQSSYAGRWSDCKREPAWHDDCEYRLKPETIKINGKEYAAPLRVAPDLGAIYWTIAFNNGGFVCNKSEWDDLIMDNGRFNANNCFATEQDCQAVADAFNAILRGDCNE